jgi:hypothetical protein
MDTVDEATQEPTPPPFIALAPGTIASDFSLKNLSKALGEAQNEFEDAVKSALNTYGGWKYTPLTGIIAAVRPALTKHHLTVSQIPITDLESKTITLHTRLVHWDSGEWMQNALDLPGELALGKDGAPKFNQQTIGGSITYAQKYAYKAIVGIPDNEEMIDSTDEKGDLPARAKTQRGGFRDKQREEQANQSQRAVAEEPAPVAQAPTGVRSGFFSKAKEFSWGLGDIKTLITREYPDAKGSTAALGEDDLNHLLSIMGANKPAEAFAEEAAK